MRGEKCRAITLGCFCRRNAKISLKKKIKKNQQITTLQGLRVQRLLWSKWQKATSVPKPWYFTQITTSTKPAEVRQKHSTLG